MKTFDVFGLGNGIVDVLVEIREDEFAELGFTKGTMELTSPADQADLLRSFSDRDRRMVSGGSVANSIVLLAQLGAKTAFACRLSDDRYGLHYKAEFEGLHVDLPNPLHIGASSGTSLILITPDAERTMRTSLGISGEFGPGEVDEDVVRQSKWIFLEGYLFCNPEKGQAAIRYAIDLAKKHQTKIALTLSDGWIVNEFRDAVEDAVSKADLVFANAGEAAALARVQDGKEAFSLLSKKLPGLVVTDGGEGCMVHLNGSSTRVPSYAVEAVDLTGAGDAFAGSFLYGILQGLPPERAAKAANFLAAQVIQRIGARIHGDASEFWHSSLMS